HLWQPPMIPLRDTVPSATFPVVNLAIIAANVLVFLYQLSLGPRFEAFLYTYGLVPRHFALASLLTSMFLHGGWFHLLGNMLYLYIFGDNVEDVLGRGRYLFFYLACGIVAALVQAFSNPASHIPMVGASGAIAGVLGAYLLLHPGANVRCFVWIVIFFRIVNVPAWTMLGLWFTMQLVSGLMAAPGRPGVAFWAHVGGFVTGLVLVVA